MDYTHKIYDDLGVYTEIAAFEPKGKVAEFQAILHVVPDLKTFSQQLESLGFAIQRLLNENILQGIIPVSARFFLSDSVNQQLEVSKLTFSILDCDICFVKQPPLDGSKIALWLQLKTKMNKGNDLFCYYEHNGYKHYYSTIYPNNKSRQSTYEQTKAILELYGEQLNAISANVENNCMRTWFFVRDIEVNYKEFVEARKDNFRKNGLTSDTHYIASTGIEGSTANPAENVILSAYAIHGLEKEQRQFLYARDFLNPTYEYGVTFERGVYIDFGDRRTVYISGTASIDNKGMILFPGNIESQVQRMWTNVEALLKEGGCDFGNIMQIIVYIRDLTDYPTVDKMFRDKFKDVPKIIVLATVCRPGWLVEMECIATKEIKNNNFRDL